MKACEQKNCFHYDTNAIGNCNGENIYCDAKNYQNRVITQKQMNKIIGKIAGYYPENIFRETTIKETNEFPQNMRKYIGRVSASMARLTCINIKKELE